MTGISNNFLLFVSWPRENTIFSALGLVLHPGAFEKNLSVVPKVLLKRFKVTQKSLNNQ